MSESSKVAREIEILRFGRLPYRDAIARMEQRARERTLGHVPDALILVEHEPVITFGRRVRREHLLAREDVLRARGVDVVEAERGGDVTYHGPGQLVGYPVIDLSPDRKDVRRYVSELESLLIDLARTFGVHAHRIDGHVGVFVDGTRKIGAIGVRIARWVTSHGFSFNVDVDLDAFACIVPCGLRDKGVTSLARECGRPISRDDAMERAAQLFVARFSERDAARH